MYATLIDRCALADGLEGIGTNTGAAVVPAIGDSLEKWVDTILAVLEHKVEKGISCERRNKEKVRTCTGNGEDPGHTQRQACGLHASTTSVSRCFSSLQSQSSTITGVGVPAPFFPNTMINRERLDFEMKCPSMMYQWWHQHSHPQSSYWSAQHRTFFFLLALADEGKN